MLIFCNLYKTLSDSTMYLQTYFIGLSYIPFYIWQTGFFYVLPIKILFAEGKQNQSPMNQTNQVITRLLILLLLWIYE